MVGVGGLSMEQDARTADGNRHVDNQYARKKSASTPSTSPGSGHTVIACPECINAAVVYWTGWWYPYSCKNPHKVICFQIFCPQIDSVTPVCKHCEAKLLSPSSSVLVPSIIILWHMGFTMPSLPTLILPIHGGLEASKPACSLPHSPVWPSQSVSPYKTL